MTAINSKIYDENLLFWQRAWNLVKTPYTQLPSLGYIERIPDLLLKRKSSPLLDLGCGSGWLSIFLARAGFKVVGVDVAGHAIELGRTWAAQEGLEIDFQVQDITSLAFSPGQFGSIVANSIFEHLTLQLADATVQSLYALLEPGGVLLACFDKVGTGPGEYYKLEDGTHVYTDRTRQGMMLRCFTSSEIKSLFRDFEIEELSEVDAGSRFLVAYRPRTD